MATADLDPAALAAQTEPAPTDAAQAEPAPDATQASHTPPDATQGPVAADTPASGPKSPRARRVPPKTSPAGKKACAKCFRVLPLTEYRPREETQGWKKPRLQSYCKECQRLEKQDRKRAKSSKTTFRQAARIIRSNPSLQRVKAAIEMMMVHCGGGPNELAELWHQNLQRLEKSSRSRIEVMRQIGMLVQMANALPAINAEIGSEEGESPGLDMAGIEAALASMPDPDLDRIAGAMTREIMRRRDAEDYVDPADLAVDDDEEADGSKSSMRGAELERRIAQLTDAELDELLATGAAFGVNPDDL